MVDDDIVIDPPQAMPKLLALRLVHHYPNLSTLRVHLQVTSLSGPPVVPGRVFRTRPAVRGQIALW